MYFYTKFQNDQLCHFTSISFQSAVRHWWFSKPHTGWHNDTVMFTNLTIGLYCLFRATFTQTLLFDDEVKFVFAFWSWGALSFMRQIQLLDLKSLKPSSVINNCLWTQSQKSSRACMEIKLQYPQTSIIGTADFTCKSCSLLNKQLIHYVVRKESNSKVYLHGLDIGREVYWNNIMMWTFIKANVCHSK